MFIYTLFKSNYNRIILNKISGKFVENSTQMKIYTKGGYVVI